MNAIDLLAIQLKRLETALHESGKTHLKFNQQRIARENMSFSGANGRLWIQPVAGSYDVSLSGKALTAEMSPEMRSICGHECNGYKQTNKRLGKRDQPYWRVEDFALVRAAVERYSKTDA